MGLSMLGAGFARIGTVSMPLASSWMAGRYRKRGATRLVGA